ncbi:polysaccharide deacetylase family protein [Bradyrhizobium sp.]|uniref:polysaccharide deacetylase family protein n=1 Tax=Bradyrhizobium sp. TaxID=376 RepID=UPI001D4C686D|nr:polysaccharide deacetylase family protein [Bradyrhizobium sp.]MBI5319907.1 polysaccharide deacetylase family protein [Bradyrhizobium sp.]
MTSENWFIRRAQMELAYFSFYARLKQRYAGGAGVVLRFQHVRPSHMGLFQPHKPHEITPRFLDRTIRALKRWNYDIVSMDEVCHRAVSLPTRSRFVALTFDGGYKDFATHAHPILRKHDVPFALYLPTAFPDGLGEAWWLALEDMIARETRISLVMDRKERHFMIYKTQAKYELFDYLSEWLRAMSPADRTFAIKDLCTRYSTDIEALSRNAWMNWDDLAKVAADPNATIGSATVNYPALSSLRDADAHREIAMGKAVTQAAFHRDVRHFAYPFGDRGAWRRQHVVMAEEAGFASAASTIGGVVEPLGRTNLYALPRVAWDGREGSIRMMRVLLSGFTFAPVQPTRNNPLRRQAAASS